MLMHFPRSRRLLSSVLLLALVSGCGAIKTTPIADSDLVEYRLKRGGSLLGEGGISLGGNKGASGQEGNGIGVNAFLWRSSLDTLSFMPLASADPFGGVIITDWYQPPNGSGERFRATAYILGRQLRADGVKVAIYRQVLQGGQWMDAVVNPSTVTEIENKILAKARELRSEVVGG